MSEIKMGPLSPKDIVAIGNSLDEYISSLVDCEVGFCIAVFEIRKKGSLQFIANRPPAEVKKAIETVHEALQQQIDGNIETKKIDGEGRPINPIDNVVPLKTK